jgi:hypothetical protein
VWWLTPVILATLEAEIRRIAVRSQPWQIVSMRPYLEKTHHKKRAGGVTHGIRPEFKPQYQKKDWPGQNFQPQLFIFLKRNHNTQTNHRPGLSYAILSHNLTTYWEPHFQF